MCKLTSSSNKFLDEVHCGPWSLQPDPEMHLFDMEGMLEITTVCGVSDGDRIA